LLDHTRSSAELAWWWKRPNLNLPNRDYHKFAEIPDTLGEITGMAVICEYGDAVMAIHETL
jgi:hypothetical protein